MNNKELSFKTIGNAKTVTGLAYLGSINSSAKIVKNLTMGEYTYILYLAPADMSGHNVCPGSTVECRAACLFGSGRSKMDVHGHISAARIKKTQLFFDNRDFFMNWLVAEITAAKAKAAKDNMTFSVRLNGTSDIDLVTMVKDGKNIMQIFPDVMFYDYTKVITRLQLMDTYKNCDLTYSYNGHNLDACKKLLDNKTARVAMVFEHDLPRTFDGYQVINGNEHDMRYIEPKGVIVGLKFKKVKTKIDLKHNPFVIPAEDPRQTW